MSCVVEALFSAKYAVDYYACNLFWSIDLHKKHELAALCNKNGGYRYNTF
jgi:hypothetical protein